MRPGFAAAGRAGDLIRVLEIPGRYPGGSTAPMAAYCRANGIDFDELAIAPYYQNAASWAVGSPGEPKFGELVDLFTADQLIDLYEMFSVYGGWKAEVAGHKTSW